jgi:hypothetical protein
MSSDYRHGDAPSVHNGKKVNSTPALSAKTSWQVERRIKTAQRPRTNRARKRRTELKKQQNRIWRAANLAIGK